MPINKEKSVVLSISNKINPIESVYTFTDGSIVSKVETAKDLGVTFDNKLRFNEHYETLTNKAFRSLGFLIRTSRYFRDIDAVIYLYNAIVLPHLIYASSVWSPFYSVNINRIEEVQRRFTRFLFRKFRLPSSDYLSRCRRLGMLTLENRRVLQDQMLLHAFIHNRSSMRSSVINVSFRTDRSRRNQDLFHEKTWRLNTSHNAPIARLIRSYNRYFNELDIFQLSRHSFRAKVLEIMWNRFN